VTIVVFCHHPIEGETDYRGRPAELTYDMKVSVDEDDDSIPFLKYECPECRRVISFEIQQFHT